MAAGLYKVVRTQEESKQEGIKQPTLMAKLVSEFLGTFMLVLTVGLSVLGGSKAPVFSIAASLMCMIYALGSVSGANFNPAVTLCLLITKRPNVLDAKTGLFYIIVQLAAGIAAGFTYMFMEPGSVVRNRCEPHVSSDSGERFPVYDLRVYWGGHCRMRFHDGDTHLRWQLRRETF